MGGPVYHANLANLPKYAMDVMLHLPDRLGKKLTELPDYNNFAAKVLQDALADQAELDRYHRAKIKKGVQAVKAGQFADEKDVEAFFDQWK